MDATCLLFYFFINSARTRVVSVWNKNIPSGISYIIIIIIIIINMKVWTACIYLN